MPVVSDHAGERRPVRRRVLLLAAALATVVVTGTAAVVNATAGADAGQPAGPAGWTVVFGDDFSGAGGTGVDPTNWLYSTGTGYPAAAANWGTGEVERMTNSTANVYHDGSGNLAIRPIRDSAGGWTSGRIESQRTDFQPPAGGRLRVEARIQLPAVTGAQAQGYWPAFWMLGAPFRGNHWNWPAVGEIDIMENVNGRDTIYGTLHCGVNPGGPCNESTGIGGSRPCAGPCQGGFHTYQVEWDRSAAPEQLRWYVDGVRYHSVSANQVDPATWASATNHGFFIILNVAIGGGWPGAPTGDTKSGAPMLVDYVSVQSAAGAAEPTTAAPTTAGPSTAGPPAPGRSTPAAGPVPGTAPTSRPAVPPKSGPKPATGAIPGSPPRPGAPPKPGTKPAAGQQPTGRDAYAPIQAESHTAQGGTGTEPTTDAGGGHSVGWVANGDWLQYTNVDFGPTAARQFSARVASGVDGGRSGLVEIRLDSPGSPPIGSFSLANTGGWQHWRTVPANISRVTGTHTVYLTFASGQPEEFLNLNWFSFGR